MGHERSDGDHLLLMHLETPDRRSSASTTPSQPLLAARRLHGFSLTEMITTISMLAILASIVIVSSNDSYTAARETLAIERVEMLNGALNRWAMARPEMIFGRRDDSSADEMKVLRDLEFRHPDPDKVDTCSPYVPPEYNPTTSSSDQDFRIRWTGRRYELLRPGQSGSGLKMVFDGSDMTEAFVFPPNYQSGGR